METRLSLRLKTLRKGLSLSPIQVVKKLKQQDLSYSSHSIYKWEDGSSIPPIDTLYALAHIYNCSVSYLIEDGNDDFLELTETEAVILRLFRTDFLFRGIVSLIMKYIERKY